MTGLQRTAGERPIGRRAFLAGGLASGVLLATGCTQSILGVDPASDNGTLFDLLWADVDRRYPSFVHKAVDWNALGAVYRPRALAATAPARLATVFGDLLAELRDMHVSITPFGAGSTIRYSAPSSSAVAAGVVSPTSYLQRGGTSTSHLLYGTVEPGVGYVRIPSFNGEGWTTELDAALATLGDVRQLIVDVRENGGGVYRTAVAAAGRFTGEARRFGYLQFRNGPAHGDLTALIPETVHPAGPLRYTGPITLLVDGGVYSSAEVFVLALRARGNVTVVGSRTGGSSGGPTPRELPNGWVYQVSEWIEYTLDRTPYEGVGLAPDVEVATGAIASRGGGDATIERALALVWGT